MKPPLVYIFAFMLATAALQAQATIDTAQFRAVYTFAYKTSPSQKEFVKTDLMYLDIGKKSSKYYSRYAQIRDSVKMAGLNQKLSAYEIVENVRQFRDRIKTIVYSLPNSGMFYVADRLVDDYYYEEKYTFPRWVLGQETKTIAGYVCKEAETIYRGRKWTAYYAPSIPVQQGPWKLWGLPGLIVYATDSEHLFEFELNGFETLKDGVPLIMENKTPTGKPYRKVSKKDWEEMERLNNRDPLTFTKQFIMGGKGEVYLTPEQKKADQDLRKKGGIPYIPLEK